MSNKTSDENVANIERLNNFANMTFLYGNRVNLNVSGLKEIQNDIKNILSDYTRQKQINEEHQKINGELRERVKALEQEIEKINKQLDLDYVDKNYIPKQKIKDLLTEIQEEYNKLDKEIDKQIKDKNKDYYKCKENIAIMQTLAYCRDKFEGLLEEK